MVGRQYKYLTEKALVELRFAPRVALLEGVREYVRDMLSTESTTSLC
jgi:hypothetical protein